MFNKFKLLSFALLAVLMAACSGDKAGGDDVRSDLLGFVPDRTALVVSVNPQQLIRSAGGDWTADADINFGPYIEDCIRQADPRDADEVLEYMAKFGKIRGVNPESFLFGTDRSINDWFLLGALTDEAQFAEYIKSIKLTLESEGQFDIYSNDGVCLVVDKADKLLWGVAAKSSSKAVKAVENIKSRAAEKAMPSWTRDYIGSCDNGFAVLGNFSALGVNLNGLLRMGGVSTDLLGGDIDYMALTYKDMDHKMVADIVTLDSDGKNVPLLNKSIYDSADLSAINLLPSDSHIKCALGINGKELFDYIPQLNQIGEPTITQMIASIQSIAYGVQSIDASNMEASLLGVGTPDTFPFKGMTLVVKCTDGKSQQLLDLIAQYAHGVEQVDANTLRMDLGRSGMKGLDALYFSNQKGALVISTDNVKLSENSVSVPSKALAYSEADANAYRSSGKFAFVGEMLKDSHGVWDAKGMHSETIFTDKCPGMIAFMLKFVSVYAPEAKAAREKAFRSYSEPDYEYDDLDDIIVEDFD